MSCAPWTSILTPPCSRDYRGSPSTTPEDILRTARVAGIDLMAVTDHLSVEYFPAAAGRSRATPATARGDRLWLLPGVEFRLSAEGVEAHLVVCLPDDGLAERTAELFRRVAFVAGRGAARPRCPRSCYPRSRSRSPRRRRCRRARASRPRRPVLRVDAPARQPAVRSPGPRRAHRRDRHRRPCERRGGGPQGARSRAAALVGLARARRDGAARDPPRPARADALRRTEALQEHAQPYDRRGRRGVRGDVHDR